MVRNEEITLFDRAKHEVASDPGSPYYAWLADQMIKDGQLDNALSVLEEGVGTNPDYITGPLLLANIYITRNKLDKARSLYNRVLQRDPDNIKAIYGLSRIAFEMREYSTGIAYLFQVISIDPYNRKITDELGRRRQEYNAFLENDPQKTVDEFDEIEDIDPQDILDATDLDGLGLDGESLPSIEDTALSGDFDLADKSLSGMDKLRTIEQEIGLAPKEVASQSDRYKAADGISKGERAGIDSLTRERKSIQPIGDKPREIPGLDLDALELDLPRVVHHRKTSGSLPSPSDQQGDLHVDSIDALKAALTSNFGQHGTKPMEKHEVKDLTPEKEKKTEPDLSDLYNLDKMKEDIASQPLNDKAEPDLKDIYPDIEDISLDDLLEGSKDPTSLLSELDDVFAEGGQADAAEEDIPDQSDLSAQHDVQHEMPEPKGKAPKSIPDPAPRSDMENLDIESDILPEHMDLAIEEDQLPEAKEAPQSGQEPPDLDEGLDTFTPPEQEPPKGESSTESMQDLSETVERLDRFTPPEEGEQIEGLVTRQEFRPEDVAEEEIDGLDLTESFAPPEDIEEADIEGLKLHEDFEGEMTPPQQAVQEDEQRVEPVEDESQGGDLTDLLEGFDDISELEDIFTGDGEFTSIKGMELDRPADMKDRVEEPLEDKGESDIDFDDIFKDGEKPAIEGSEAEEAVRPEQLEASPDIEPDGGTSPMSEILEEIGEEAFQEEQHEISTGESPESQKGQRSKDIKSELSSLLKGVESKFEEDALVPPDADISPTQITKIDDMNSLAQILGVDLSKREAPLATPEQEKLHMKGSELFDMLKQQGYEEKQAKPEDQDQLRSIRQKQDFVLDLSSFEDSTLEEIDIDGMEEVLPEKEKTVPPSPKAVPPEQHKVDESALEAERESEKVVSNMEELLDALDIGNLPDLSDMVSSENKGTDIIIGPEEDEGLDDLLDGTDIDDITGEQSELEELLKSGSWGEEKKPEEPKPQGRTQKSISVSKARDEDDPDDELVDLKGQKELEDMLMTGDWSGEISREESDVPDDAFVPDFGLEEEIDKTPSPKARDNKEKQPQPSKKSDIPHEDDDDDDESQIFKRLKDAVSDRDKILDRPIPKKTRKILSLDDTQSEELDETGAKAQKDLEALPSSSDWNSHVEQPPEKHRFSPETMDTDAELRKILEQDVFKADENVDGPSAKPPEPSSKVGHLHKPDKVEGEELSTEGVSEQQELEKLLNSDMWRREPKPEQPSSEFSEKAGSKEAMNELRDLLRSEVFEEPPKSPTVEKKVDDTYQGEIVTETMAEIFAAQGQTEDAINVYRKLVHLAHPERAKRFKMRLQMLEKRLKEEG